MRSGALPRNRFRWLAGVVRTLAVGSLISLGLPWFSGTSDGDEVVVVGADTSDWGFTAGMVALALTIAAAAARPRAVVLLAGGLLGLTLWRLPRGVHESAPQLMWGAYVAMGIGLALIALASLATATRAQRSSGTRHD
jgi:hypothetical protein